MQLFKLSREGKGVLFDRSQLGNNDSPSFAGWKDDQFKLFCCLAGSDYSAKIRGFGIKTAHRLVARCKSFPRVADCLQVSYGVSSAEVLDLARAFLTFKYQVSSR